MHKLNDRYSTYIIVCHNVSKQNNKFKTKKTKNDEEQETEEEEVGGKQRNDLI